MCVWCLFSPCVTVAIRAEPYGSVFVGDPDAVEWVRSHHQEEVEHLKELRLERTSGEEQRIKSELDWNVSPTCSRILAEMGEQYLFL